MAAHPSQIRSAIGALRDLSAQLTEISDALEAFWRKQQRFDARQDQSIFVQHSRACWLSLHRKTVVYPI
jgi:hypothetical protein